MHKIAVIPGDGTGPEVVREGLKALAAVADKVGFEYETADYDFGGDRYLRTGEVLPESAVEELRQFDAIYLGAIGHPEVKPGILEKGILLHLRFELDQYINLRPVKLYPNVDTPLKDKGPDDIDFVVVRENTEGLYAGSGGFLKKGTPDEIAVQESINTRKGAERCLRYAFEYTRRRNQDKKLTLCGKTNVLTFAWDLNGDGDFSDASGMNPTLTSEELTALGLGDGPSQFMMTLRVDDGYNDTSEDTAPLTINNLSPNITSFSSSSPELGGVSAGEEVTVNGTFINPGTLDTHTAVIDWGDGTITSAGIIEAEGAGTIDGNHTYENGGVYTITVTLSDDDSAVAMATTSAVVAGIGVNDGVLFIVGTDGKDHVNIRLARNRRSNKNGDGRVIRVAAGFNAGKDARGSQGNQGSPSEVVTEYDADAVTKIVVLLGNGSDHVQIHENVTIDTYVDTGADNNFVVAHNNGYVSHSTSDDVFANTEFSDLLLTV